MAGARGGGLGVGIFDAIVVLWLPTLHRVGCDVQQVFPSHIYTLYRSSP